MKKSSILLTLVILALPSIIFTQDDLRYVDPIFPEVAIISDVEYAQNISVHPATGELDTTSLVMDIYAPLGDQVGIQRPVVLYLHGGVLIPAFFNGQVTGSKLDSTVVEVCTRLAQSGYTAVAPTYRLGWNPVAADIHVRNGTLLQAFYRATHDTRAAVRFLRKTVMENGNPYRIDPTRIALWGEEIGGSVALGAGYLDDYLEIAGIGKFINTETFEPYILEDRDGDVYGLDSTVFNLPSWTEYSSEVDFVFNMGGAILDTSWIDMAAPEQPTVASVHCVYDAKIPFGDGPQFSFGPDPFFSIHGSRILHEKANAAGVNAPIDFSAWNLVDDAEAINDSIVALSDVTINLFNLGQSLTTLASPHMYPLRSEDNQFMASPWSWWDRPLLDSVVAEVNDSLDTNFDADVLHNFQIERYTPTMSAERARAYIDTAFMVFQPRACCALELEECCPLTQVEGQPLEDKMTGLQLAPNPVMDFLQIQTKPEYPLKGVALFSTDGARLLAIQNINQRQYKIDCQALPPGIYLLQVFFEHGRQTKKIIVGK
ncbi:MAG: T9SS type A sorting domain-containing protein [Bacteroidota bacterium]